MNVAHSNQSDKPGSVAPSFQGAQAAADSLLSLANKLRADVCAGVQAGQSFDDIERAVLKMGRHAMELSFPCRA